MPPAQNTGPAFLERAYLDLGLTEGTLLEATAGPSEHVGAEEWRRLGDWLMLAHRVGAERVFFVDDDPVVVFSALPPGATEVDVVQAYRRTWSMSRPRCLFLATEGELRVYALTVPPVEEGDNPDDLVPLEVVRRATEVAETLADFHRDRLESGATFESGLLSQREGRADQQLIADVRAATSELVRLGLTRLTAHALIERVILVRYLEDRNVLLPSYFEAIANAQPDWQEIIAKRNRSLNFGRDSVFSACLINLELTYAVFESLAHDFNGDLFLPIVGESQIDEEHLLLVKALLDGTATVTQEALFLWAYDFSVVPTSLISSMYEMFHQEELAEDDSGTYYTPAELVEFVLARVLTEKVLDGRPSICDPSCGSGIFLVEAYRLIVRHETVRAGRALSPEELRTLLLERIAGVDVDEQAVRLAAFSLYLALLNYQSPQDIRTAGPLPPLISRGGRHLAPLVVADAFSPTADHDSTASAAAATNRSLPWPAHHFDIVLGNPPWTEPSGGRGRSEGERWAMSAGHAFADRNQSQLFLWRALSLLREGGLAALLVSATAFHNNRSKTFREQWLSHVRLEQVVNFTLARRIFFTESVAPFFLVSFRAADPAAVDQRFIYETVRPSPALRTTASMAFGRLDRRIVDQQSLLTRDYLWKIYAWGNHHDEALVARLDQEQRMEDFLPEGSTPRWGYQRGGRDRAAREPSATLRRLPSLRTFEPWGPLEQDWFEPSPLSVKREPDERIYRGQRLLVRRGVRTNFGPIARLESAPLSFRHTTYCLPLQHLPTWKAQVLFGVLMSSLGRYWLFMKSGSWGVWHDSVLAEELLGLPMRMRNAKDPATRRLVAAVDALVKATPSQDAQGQLPPAGQFERATEDGGVTDALRRIDDAAMDLFQLLPAERDLVFDFWEAYAGESGMSRMPSIADEAGTITDLDAAAENPMTRYLEAFLRNWNPRLQPDAELEWRVLRDPMVPVLAVVFETRFSGKAQEVSLSSAPTTDGDDWRELLKRINQVLSPQPRRSLFALGVVRAVTDTAIVVIKRDERRLWTPSAAREDAEAALVRAMALQGA